MSERVNVLMLGGAKRVSLARLLKSAGSRLGIDVSIVSYEIVPEVPIASEGEVVVGLRWRDAGIYDSLAQVISERHINVVLPFVDGAIEICSALRRRHPDVFIPVSDFEVAHTMFDKAEAARVFATHGFDIPATYDGNDCRFPAILKPREGSASRGIVVARTAKDLAEAGDLSRYLVQEYIENADEYTVDCYVSTVSGRVACAVPRLRISTSGGEVDRTETRRIPTLMQQSEHILTELKFRGPVTLQFLHDKATDRYLLMEINPRLGGGVVCSIHAGADIAEMILRESRGEEARRIDDWRDRALMTRYFAEVMF